MFELHFMPGEYVALRQHLLVSAPREQAAFGFMPKDAVDAGRQLPVKKIELLEDGDFVVRSSDYLELTDDARQRIIRTAHDGSFAVVEFHSHPFNLPAEFSSADRMGLQRSVPHMLWRLKGRPYLAVVIGPNDFDGLAWLPDKRLFQLSSIIDGDTLFSATGRSISRCQSMI